MWAVLPCYALSVVGSHIVGGYTCMRMIVVDGGSSILQEPSTNPALCQEVRLTFCRDRCWRGPCFSDVCCRFQEAVLLLIDNVHTYSRRRARLFDLVGGQTTLHDVEIY